MTIILTLKHEKIHPPQVGKAKKTARVYLSRTELKTFDFEKRYRVTIIEEDVNGEPYPFDQNNPIAEKHIPIVIPDMKIYQYDSVLPHISIIKRRSQHLDFEKTYTIILEDQE